MSYPAGIYPLYQATWPGLPARIQAAAELGWDWEAVTTPFVEEVDGTVVSHAGVLEYDLWIEGERVSVAGLHAVCTLPDHRGRGHARSVLNRALAYVDSKGLPAVLATDKPGVYEPHGFRVVPERRFAVGATGPQRFATTSVEDPATVERYHGSRTPISNRLGTLAPCWMFGICEVLETGGLEQIHHSEALDALLVYDRGEDGTITVLDVVATEIPSLDALLDALPEARNVVLAFHPDRVAGALDRATPVPSPEDDLWMVRGLDLPSGLGQLPLLSRH